MKKITIDNILMKLSYFIFLILIKPAFFNQNAKLNSIVNAIIIGLNMIILLLFIVNKNKSKIVIYISLFFLALFFSTVINGISIGYFLKNYLPMYGFAVYLEMVIKINKDKALNNLSNLLSILIIINFISVLLLPHNSINMEERKFFLGYDNSFVPIILLGCCIVLMNSYYKCNKLNLMSIITLICTLSSCFLIYSSTAKVGASLLIFFIIVLFLNKNSLFRIFNYNSFLITSLLIFLGVIIFKIQNYFSYIIVDLLHRDLTFTGRTYIWNLAIQFIKKSPIFGYGVIDPSVSKITMGIYHAHNTYLNIMFLGGIVSLLIYFIVLFQTNKIFKKFYNKKQAYILSAAFSIYFIMSIDEFYVKNHMFYVVLILSNYIPTYIKRKDLE